MSKKENTTIKIKCDSANTAKATMAYLSGYSSEITGAINKMLRQQGLGATDAVFEDIDMEKLTLGISVNPTDKGDVFVLNDSKELTIDSYKNLENGELYGFLINSGVAIYIYDDKDFDKHIQTANSFAVVKDMLVELPAIVDQQRKAHEAEQLAVAQSEAETIETVEDAEVVEENSSPSEVTNEPVMSVNK